jgi:hypothetical protein
MRIYHLFRGAPFDAEHIELISSAFEDVSQQLGLGRREDAIRDIVARAILECAQRGIATPSRCANARATSCRLRSASLRAPFRHCAHLRQRRIDFVARSNQNGGMALTSVKARALRDANLTRVTPPQVGSRRDIRQRGGNFRIATVTNPA